MAVEYNGLFKNPEIFFRLAVKPYYKGTYDERMAAGTTSCSREANMRW